MVLKVIANYGESESTITDRATTELISTTMSGIDWNIFHQVVLEQANGDWMEVGGSLCDDGLSVMYQEDGGQFVISQAPMSIEHLTAILLSYLQRDNRFKQENKFE